MLALAADYYTGVYQSALASQVRLSAVAPVLVVSIWAVRRWRSDLRTLAVAGALVGPCPSGAVRGCMSRP
ncbi:hypothetical protein NKH18_46385 [Streptomyces sp. M10(2022)]